MSKLLPTALALSLLAVPAFAQGTAITPGQSIANAPGGSARAVPAAPPPAATTHAAPKADRTAKSKDCSMQADKEGLHGKARKAFRSKCKAGKA